MKRFLVITGALLGLAIALTVFVWFMLQTALQDAASPAPNAPNEPVGTPQAATTTPDQPDLVTATPEENTSTQNIVAEEYEYAPVELNSLDLSASQKSLLDTVGVDAETFVITPAMQACAYVELGEVRVAEILAGDTPTLREGIRLSGCFR